MRGERTASDRFRGRIEAIARRLSRSPSTICRETKLTRREPAIAPAMPTSLHGIVPGPPCLRTGLAPVAGSYHHDSGFALVAPMVENIL